MPFDPLAWALGYAASKVVGRVFTTTLSQKLATVTETWAHELPNGLYLYPAALFPAREEGDAHPARDALADKLTIGYVPEEPVWLDALLERWSQVHRASPEVQPFFASDETTVRPFLVDLSRRLQHECRLDQRLFQPTVLEKLREIEGKIDLASAREDVQRRKAITWRSFVTQWLPLVGDDMRAGSQFVSTHFALGLYSVFGPELHREFDLLVSCSEAATTDGPRSGVAFVLPDAALAAAMRNNTKASLSSEHKQRESLRPALEHLAAEWVVKTQLPATSALVLGHSTYDGPGKRISLELLSGVPQPVTIHREMTTSEGVRLFMAVTGSNNSILQLHFDSPSTPARKLLLDRDLTKSVDFRRMRVDAANPYERWDYVFDSYEQAVAADGAA